MKFKRVVENYIHPHSKEAISEYRKLTKIDDECKLTEEMIDEWALTECATKYNVQKADLRHMLLGEDVTIDQAARALEQQKEIVHTKTEIENELDRTLKIAQRMHRRGTTGGYPALLLEGDGGVGKTSIVNQWAQENGVHFFNYDLRTASIESLQGVIANHPDEQEFVIRKISKELLVPLSKPNTVMFIDEYNRGKAAVRNALLDLIINHKMAVPMIGEYEESKKVYAPYGELEENGYLYFPNLLFVVAAQNPYQSNYSGTQELDAAEVDRFAIKKVEANNEAVLQFLVQKFNRDIEADKAAEDAEGVLEGERKIAIATTLLEAPTFYFDTGAEREELFDENPSNKYLSPRSLQYLLEKCDGTKEDFLARWDDYCNHKKKFIVEEILQNYTDIQDRANDAISEPSESDIFTSKETPGQLFRKMYMQ